MWPMSRGTNKGEMIMDELNLTSVLATLMHDPSTLHLPDPE